MKIKIVVAVNKKDYWFCKICIASIRHFYPDHEIYLLKDESNGVFSTKEIEFYWDVKTIDFSVKKFGWSGSKMHFYTDKRFKDDVFFVIDCDIVFIGKILDNPFVLNFDTDIIISKEIVADPLSTWFTKTYFDYKKVLTFDKAFVFPGYTFNCGQLFCKGSFLDRGLLEPYFDFNQFPSWKRLDIFPMVDQSVFNYLLPTLENKNQLKIGKEDYMIWSESTETQSLDLTDIIKGEQYLKIIHWAGALRIPYINKMTRPDILNFFEINYYKIIPFGNYLRQLRKINSVFIYFAKKYYHKIKNIPK